MKIGFLSLGCPKNLVDGEVMLGIARDAGHELTTDAASAEVLVVNTCAFIDKAKQESIDAILEMAQHKQSGNCSRLVVTGCLAERYRDELRSEIPEIDAVLGTGEVDRILSALGAEARCRGSGLGLGVRHEGRELSVATFQQLVGDFAPKTSPEPRIPNPGTSDISLRRRNAASFDDAAAFRLRESGRGLRLHLRVLHHPDAPRKVSQPRRVIDREGSAIAGGARREGAAADFAGHDVLRHRPG